MKLISPLLLSIALLEPALAAPSCLRGQQPYGERCVSQRMADYISCVEASGANRSELSEQVKQIGEIQSASRLPAAAITGSSTRGQAYLDSRSESTLLRLFELKWFPGGMSQCAKAMTQNIAPPELQMALRQLANKSDVASIINAVDAAVDRVDAFELELTYAFPMSAVGVDPKAKEFMKRDFDFYQIITKNMAGESQTGIAKDMYGATPGADEAKMLSAFDRSLQILVRTTPPILFATKLSDPKTDTLREFVAQRVAVGPISSTETYSQSIASYSLPNPRSIASFPPPHVAAAKEHWAIPNKKPEDPEFKVTWRYRLFSSPATGLRLLRDYERASFVLVAPRFNPNLDSSPSLAAYGEPFGRVIRCKLYVAGRTLSWDEDPTKTDDRVFSTPRQGRPSQFIGQLISPR